MQNHSEQLPGMYHDMPDHSYKRCRQVHFTSGPRLLAAVWAIPSPVPVLRKIGH